MKRYHYRMIESSGYVHQNWLFADNLNDAWIRLAHVVGELSVYNALMIVSMHIDKETD